MKMLKVHKLTDFFGNCFQFGLSSTDQNDIKSFFGQ